MLNTICIACQYGFHENHINLIEIPHEGMLGGAQCTCNGECKDGRYYPKQVTDFVKFMKEDL